jgi:hypothetical protein
MGAGNAVLWVGNSPVGLFSLIGDWANVRKTPQKRAGFLQTCQFAEYYQRKRQTGAKGRQMVNKDAIPLAAAARILRCSTDTLHRWHEAGTLPFERRGVPPAPGKIDYRRIYVLPEHLDLPIELVSKTKTAA